MRRTLTILTTVFSLGSFALTPDQKTLPIGLAPWEESRLAGEAPMTAAPVGPVISLAEWEVSKGVMVLWTNPSLIKALKQNGPVYLFSDSENEKSWWKDFLVKNSISSQDVNHFVIPTDSIWIRDYGPWFILDGNRDFGMVDTKYNRPRPLDDQVPVHLSKILGVPYYEPGLVHTGGNYYNDALGSAFSSTLVFTENSGLSKDLVLDRMFKFLGIERYTTSRLSPGTTIEHIDTFGKLVSPDTWVFSEFPTGSQHKTDSDNMVKLIQTLKSPYGTPYKIHRLKMVKAPGGDFRAYLNSFISNGFIYFPKYGDSVDLEVAKTYEKALPGYKAIGVDAMGTTWGDSVHCRTRNLLTRDALFLFPQVAQKGKGKLEVTLEAIPSPEAELSSAPLLHWQKNGTAEADLAFNHVKNNDWKLELGGLNPGDRIELWISAEDSSGKKRSEPRFAPQQRIEVEVNDASF